MKTAKLRVAGEMETKTAPGTGREITAGKWWAAALALVAFGITMRLFFRDIPNFSPVAAVALYAGFLFGGIRRAIWVPLAVMAASDWVIGGYDGKLMVVVYAMLALPVVWGSGISAWHRRGGRVSVIATCLFATVFGSFAFYFVTNSAVWAFSSWYSRDWSGWVECLAAGLPFFRYTLGGDLAFATALFGGHFAFVAVRQSLVARQRAAHASHTVASL